MPSDESEGTFYRAVGWVVMFLLGPIHFGGELVGPIGGTDWRLWFCAFGGTWFWAFIVIEVVGLV